MPKEKTTTRKTKARAPEGKKKKGKLTDSCAVAVDVSLACCTDPNAPKRGLSAYMFFANEQRDNVREENPGISFGMDLQPHRRKHSANHDRWYSGQVGKVLGERWKALNTKQREPYEAKAQADKKRYEEEKATYAVSQHLSSLSLSEFNLVDPLFLRRPVATRKRNPPSRLPSSAPRRLAMAPTWAEFLNPSLSAHPCP